MKEIIPAILSKSFSEIKYKVGLVADHVDTVQVDLCEGKFADNKTWPFTGDNGEFAHLAAEQEGLPFWEQVNYEFDVMVKEPEGMIGDLVRAGASRILVHLESTEKMEDILREWGNAVEIGIALKPKTPLAELDSFMHEVTVVQFMGSDFIAHAGISLDPSIFERIRTFKKKYPEHAVSIDIGVNFETAPELLAAGADHLVAGSAIFKADDPVLAIKRFRDLL